MVINLQKAQTNSAASSPSSLSPANQTKSNRPSLAGADLKDIHKSAKVTIPGYSTQEEDPLEADFNKMVEGKWVGKIQGGVQNAGSVLKDSGSAFGKILESLKDITKLGVTKTATNSTAITGIAGVGAALAGLKSVKNILKMPRIFFDPKSDKVSWAMYGLLGILQGGVGLVLASPFFGTKSPLIKRINGKDIVQLKSVIGGVLAAFGLSTWMKVVQNVSPLAKSETLKEIANAPNDVLKALTTNTQGVNAAPPGGAGIPGLAG